MRHKNVSMMHRRGYLRLTGMMTGVALLAAGQVSADDSVAGSTRGSEAEVTFHGTLIEAPPCVVNGGEPIVVDFGNEVMTTRIDGVTYKKDINFTLDCSEAISRKQKIRISGSTATFDTKALSAGQPGFAIALYQGTERYTPGEWLLFTDPVLPDLKAVPVKQDGVTLDGGRFTVLASLVVDYQ
ncbi:fimbrial protein (plasmid) [Enterobacter sp. JS8-1]|uniref:fimbrial protein n=1 Tax=Enterobacter sp. JS8-1 TaxID=3411633 RepID=UPI003BA16B78